MSIHYIEPLSRAISRTKQALFNPMDPRKWFVVGFSAFLAALTDVQVSGGVPNTGIRKTSEFRSGSSVVLPSKSLGMAGKPSRMGDADRLCLVSIFGD